jgi:hypothetical protein
MNAPNVLTDTKASRVIVGCKLPNGLHLDLKDKSGEVRRVTINGANSARIVGGYGLTHDVDAEFMTDWFKRNHKHPAVLNRSIFIHAEEASARAIAKEQAEVTTGLQAIDPVKAGMLNNENDEVDKKELKKFREMQAKNPDRNRQIEE